MGLYVQNHLENGWIIWIGNLNKLGLYTNMTMTNILSGLVESVLLIHSVHLKYTPAVVRDIINITLFSLSTTTYLSKSLIGHATQSLSSIHVGWNATFLLPYLLFVVLDVSNLLRNGAFVRISLKDLVVFTTFTHQQKMPTSGRYCAGGHQEINSEDWRICECVCAVDLSQDASWHFQVKEARNLDCNNFESGHNKS